MYFTFNVPKTVLQYEKLIFSMYCYNLNIYKFCDILLNRTTLRVLKAIRNNYCLENVSLHLATSILHLKNRISFML